MEHADEITRAHLEQVATGMLDDPDLLSRIMRNPELASQVEQIRRDNELVGELMSVDTQTTPHNFDPIPGYELLEEIHRGGQGIVQRARQRSADRLVAIKTLLQGAFASEAQRHRFEREVRLVARLNHPSIVTVHESGRTAMGSHFIVMELVEGVPVDEYAASLREKNDLRNIVRLFVAIADAIRYAHQRGVIHRDLKPGNILVDDSGTPHILDFGIARAFGEDSQAEPLATRTGEFVGTLAYASPEQIASDPDLLDVRSDVYALGVLLYQALTGTRPLDISGPLGAIIARIATQEPDPPSAANPKIDHDLDTITLTALAKAASERYQTANDLRDDLQRWIEGRAISARAHDFWYIARKALIRYRVPVAIASVFLLLIIGFSIATGTFALSAQRENKALTGTVRGLTNSLRGIDRETSASPVRTLTDFLSLLVENIQSEVENRVDVESAVREAAGIAYLDDPATYDQAQAQLLRAYKLREQSLDPPHPDLAASLHNLGRLRFKQQRYSEAESYYRKALDMRTKLFGRENAQVARTTHHLAYTLQKQGRLDEAQKYWTEALRIRRAVLEPDDADIANTLSGLATNSLERGDNAGAATAARDALDIVLAHPDFGPNSLQAGRVTHNLGVALSNLGRLDEAEDKLREAIRIKTLREPDSIHRARSLSALARVLSRKGQPDSALAFAEQSDELFGRIQAGADPEAIANLRLLYEIYQNLQRPNDAQAIAARIKSTSSAAASTHKQPKP
jgi:eukaryotic-like serine/threonine-protein kinase